MASDINATSAVLARGAAPASGARSVVTLDVDPRSFCSAHEHATRTNYAQRLAAVIGGTFAGTYDAYDARQPCGGAPYFVPSDTVTDPARARAMGILGPDDLFGGVVPWAFVATKAITHPPIDAHATVPAGWSTRFAAEIGDAALPGFSCFSAEQARRAGRALLADGPVRVKPADASGGREQAVVTSVDALDRCIDALAPARIAAHGLVLEANLEDPCTRSVGQLRVAGLVISYCGEQRSTRDNAGQEAYGGSDLTLVRGDFEALIASVEPSPPLRRAIEQARRYHRAVIDCYAGFFASRVNYDVVQGLDDQGRWHSGVLEQSWRVGGATGAEIAALEVFQRDPACDRVRASCFEVYGSAPPPPPEAIVTYRGCDPQVGPLCKYTLLVNADAVDTP